MKPEKPSANHKRTQTNNSEKLEIFADSRRIERIVENDKELNDVLNLAEAAAILRVHPVTLRKRAAAWGVPHRRLGSEWRFSRKVLTAWIQQQDAA
jgi:Helix-turn-helix domain